jgi:hypothetical protein
MLSSTLILVHAGLEWHAELIRGSDACNERVHRDACIKQNEKRNLKTHLYVCRKVAVVEYSYSSYTKTPPDTKENPAQP